MIECRYCGEQFETEQAVNSHIGKVHPSNVVQMFKPSEDQLKALEASMDMETKPTISAFMDKAGVSRRNWYNWIDDPEFVKWWNAQWEMYMGAGVFHLDKISYMKAASDFRYMELLQMKYGKFKRKEERDITSGGHRLSAGLILYEDDSVQE